jgi:hypothetical protein
MKSKVLAIILLVSTTIIGHSNTSFAEACFTATGTVTTQNVSPIQQIGNITLNLLNSTNNPVFSNTGSLIGNITGGGFGVVTLSHVATFSSAQSFVTQDDQARITGVRDFLADGTACSYYIHENISKIITGTGFFGGVKSVNIYADGYISNCPGENRNEFTLSGELCK